MLSPLSHLLHGRVLAGALTVVAVGCQADAPAGVPPAVVSAFMGDASALRGGAPALVAELAIAEEPDCDRHPDAEYGFFVDLDPEASPRTGAVGPALEGLGADLRISARCEDGELISPAGEVSVVNIAGERPSWLLTITITTPDLPPRFEWIAYSRVGGEVSRVPAAPDVGRAIEVVL